MQTTKRRNQGRNGESEKRLRYAIYTRISTDMQSDLSLEAQETRCRQEIANRGGVVVAVYKDTAKSGWSLEREGFNALRTAAEHGKFDAIMFWKFDRLARNHDHTVMIKMLLRKDYGLKLHCVEGFSEDDDDSAYAAMMEQMLAVFSAYYSKNLSNETKRGKLQRAMNGEFNGSVAPLGYKLVTAKQATPEQRSGLYVDLRAAAIVRRAFKLYATGAYSDGDIAEWMNGWRYIRQMRQGQKPINRDMIRELLQNRTYTGRVPHTDTVYKGSMGQGKMSRRGRSEWFEGKHQAIIGDQLFEEVQTARANAARLRQKPSDVKTYILHDRVFCARCIANKPAGLVHPNYGRMRPYWHNQMERGYYRCLSYDHGFGRCEQRAVQVTRIDEQIAQFLINLRIPADYRERIEAEVNNRIENAAALQRMKEIEAIIARIDFSWEKGFMTQEAYLAKRTELQREIEALRPVDYEELTEAADLLTNFGHYWRQCETTENPDEARQQLVAKIVERVFVYEGDILAVVLHGDYAVVLAENEIAPLEVRSAIKTTLENLTGSEVFSQSGGDGSRTRDLCLDRAIC